ncbi:MAG: hypothetical protein HY509_02185, partial [Acidobacteria bacterium]|nr:hypothetical protein [Acidobacteriota bacterium]
MRKSARIRVFDLVKKLGVPKEDVLRVLRELSVGARSTLTTVDESVAQTVELRLKHQARHPARARKEPGQAEVPPKLRPRLVRRDAATGRALELIEEARERQKPAPPQPVEAAGEAGAKPALAEALPAAAKAKPPAPE